MHQTMKSTNFEPLRSKYSKVWHYAKVNSMKEVAVDSSMEAFQWFPQQIKIECHKTVELNFGLLYHLRPALMMLLYQIPICFV